MVTLQFLVTLTSYIFYSSVCVVLKAAMNYLLLDILLHTKFEVVFLKKEIIAVMILILAKYSTDSK